MVLTKCIPRIYLLAFALCLLAFQQTAFAQCGIKGSVVDSTKTPLAFTTLSLLNAADSSVYKGGMSDEKGGYCFSSVKSGNYLLKVSALGFGVELGSPFKFDSANAITVSDIIMYSKVKNLKEFSVTEIRDPIEFKNGNIIVNIGGSPLAVGNTAYDLLSHLPGVSIEGDNISIDGNAGVKVFIDDRVQQMSGQQLINFLRSISSAGIDKIEVLKNPPVKYDAAGTAGIINIKTKKLKITGFSGSVNYNLAYGKDFYHNTGLSLNYKGKKVAFFSGIDLGTGDLQFQDDLYKSVTFNSVTTVLDQKSVEFDYSFIPVYNAGMDWYINKNNTLGVKLQGEYAEAIRTKPGTTQMSDSSLGYDELGFSRRVKNHWHYFNGNINLEHLFDTVGTLLRFSTDYIGPFVDYYNGTYENYFYDVNGTETSPALNFNASNTLDTRILASKIDFEKKLSKTLSMEAGIKESYQLITSDYLLQVKDVITGTYSTDSTFTNRFSYAENISAAYMNLNKEYKKVNLQLGLRAENTDIHSESITGTFEFDKQYLNVFPVASVDYTRSDKSVFQLSYNYRINRPDYNSFNPYREFQNILTSRTGNPYISPSFANNMNLTHTYNRKLSNSLSYRRVSKPYMSYVTQNDSTKETVFHLGNLKLSNIIAYSLFFRTDIKKWWSFTGRGVIYYLDYTGKINGTDYKAHAVPYRAFLNNQFVLPGKIKLEMMVIYDGPRLSESNHYKSRGGLNVALKRSVLKNKLNFTLGLEDVFRTAAFEYYVDLPDQNWSSYQYNDMRRLKIGISYDFGNIKVDQREVNAADTEQQRMGR